MEGTLCITFVWIVCLLVHKVKTSDNTEFNRTKQTLQKQTHSSIEGCESTNQPAEDTEIALQFRTSNYIRKRRAAIHYIYVSHLIAHWSSNDSDSQK